MIRGVHIARYRGIRELTADGFGRVNLIIGRNDCGKTAFMEALQLVESGDDVARHLLRAQRNRLGRLIKSHDFERFWRPIFFDLDSKTGLQISDNHRDGTEQVLKIREDEVSVGEVIPDRSLDMRDPGDDGYEKEDVFMRPTWALEFERTAHEQFIQQRIQGTPTRLKLLSSVNGVPKRPAFSNQTGSVWIAAGSGLGESKIRFVSALKQRSGDQSLLELLREVDSRVSGIELLAPGGDVAELFVRLNNGVPLLPVELMGDGFQRCLELGAAAAAHDWPTLFIDEVENGMHHLVLEPLWRWIGAISHRRSLQVFATTHSDECIDAARRAFQTRRDDGLRVIRLDRQESETRAVIYDQALIEAAERTGTEIRG
jgi:hypothetical protein